MLRVISFLIFCLGSTYSFAYEENLNEKNRVNERLQQFTSVLNARNGDLSEFWTQDGKLINPISGEVVDGNQNIAKYLQGKVLELKGNKVTFEVGNLIFPDDRSAVVEGVLKVYDSNNLVEQRARKIELQKKDDGKWYLYTVREIPVEQAPSAYEHLKGLEWLVGNWKDEDENVTIQFSTNWDKFKNFLIQKFTMKVYGLEAMEGIQIIGWDPIEKKIRSWVYDSDGGFGSGVWEQKGNSVWEAALNYVLSDGKKGSAKNIYKKIDDKSYSYTSIDRKIEGEALPNVENVTVQKEGS